MNRLTLAVLQACPTQFDGPLFREIARAGSLDLTVYYLDTDQTGQCMDQELGFAPNWDIPVTSGYRQVRCPQGFWRRLGFLRRECFSGGKYDLVIVPGYGRLDLALLAFLLRSQRLGMRLDTVSIYPESAGKTRLKRAVLKLLFPRYSAFHPVGSLSEGFLRALGISEDRIFRFPYAADNAYLRRASEEFRQRRNELLQDQQIPPHHFVVLGVLKFVPRENPMELLRAFHIFHQQYPDSALILVGTGALEAEMRGYITAHGLSGAVRLVGYARYSELPKWYGISNVFVHPSVREPWGVSVNEAMACGLPVVASSLVGSSYDLIQDGVNGYQYPSGNAEALAECLAKIASRPDRGRQLGEGSAHIISSWDYAATLRSLESALHKIETESIPRTDFANHFLAARDAARRSQAH
jgi:glycosyltransferase involved in cell wall biosynthesis